MGPLQERVLRLIEREALVPHDGRVLVALSGGGDSVALTTLLCQTASAGAFTLTGLLHINHQLRGAAAEADERFCHELARTLSLPITVERVDVGALARAEGISIEEAGHRARYAIFDRMAAGPGIDRIATGHTQDDLAETFLLRLIRGAGSGGLAGIRPRSGDVIRPLLAVSRAELRTYLANRGQSFREDESNLDLRITRNRVRHRLVPFLAEHFSPGIVEVLARDAAIARGDAEWIDRTVNTAVRKIVSYEKGMVTVDVDRLHGQPVALARRIAKQVLERFTDRAVGFDHVERLLDLAAAPDTPVAEADFPGARVERRGSRFIMLQQPRPRHRHTFCATGFEYQLGVPGEVAIKEAGLVVSADRAPTGTVTAMTLSARGSTVAVAETVLSVPLTVRNWRPGDTFRPLGLGGHKKLQDFFVDRKIDRDERRVIPIVTDAHRGIVWVVGHGVADDFRVTDGTQGVIILRARGLGNAG